MKKILMIIDMQNGFTKTPITKILKEKITRLSNSKKFDYIFATRFFNTKNSPYVRFVDWKEMMSAPDTDLIDGLNFDEVIDKYVYTCITDEFLEKLKKVNGGVMPDEVYLCGVDTDCCVLKNATDLFEHNIKPMILMDYCASNGGPLSHISATIVLERLFGKSSLIEGDIKK